MNSRLSLQIVFCFLFLIVSQSMAFSRQYDSSVGRFLQEDSEWSVSLYNYANNSPTIYVDPYGKAACQGASSCSPDAGPNLDLSAPPAGTSVKRNFIDMIEFEKHYWSNVDWAVGAEAQGGLTILEGFNVGANTMYFFDEDRIGNYTFTEVDKGVFNFSASPLLTIAWNDKHTGMGAWEGFFSNANFGLGAISVSGFEGGGWTGIQIGPSIGVPFSLYRGRARYAKFTLWD